MVPKTLILSSITISMKTDPHTSVSEFDLWMTFDPKMETSIIPRENWQWHHHQSLWMWPLDYRWRQNVDLHHDPQVKLIPSPKFENLTSGGPLTPKSWSRSWSPGKRILPLKFQNLTSGWPLTPKWWHTWSLGKTDPATKFQNLTSGWPLTPNNEQPKAILGQWFF